MTRALAWVVWALAALNVTAIAIWCAGMGLLLNRSYAHMDKWPSDFAVFWEVGRRVLAGRAAEAFDRAAMAPAWVVPEGASYVWQPLWLYPPTWAAVIAPFGALPYSVAFALYTALSLAAFAWALAPVVRGLPGGIALTLAAPTVLAAASLGNNGLLTAAAATLALRWLVSGLTAHRAGEFGGAAGRAGAFGGAAGRAGAFGGAAGRAGAVVGAVGRAGASGGAVGRAGAVGGAVQRVAAGLAMAALVVKPQLALAMPLAAVAAGAWRTVAVAAAATVAALAAATLVTGTGYWAALLGALAEHDAGIRGAGGYQAEVARHGYLDLSITPYAWLRGRGLADGAALALHGALGLAGLSVAAVGWRALARRADRQDRTGSDAPSVNDSSDDGRLAHALIALTLMLSVLLPHRALFYEATFFVAAALCLARAGAGATLAGRAAILVAFVAVPRPLLEALGLPVGGSTVPGLVAAAAYAAWLVLRLVRVDAAGTEAAVGAGGPSGVAGPAPAEAASPAGQAGGSAV